MGDLLSYLVDAGVAGIILFAFVMGWIHSEKTCPDHNLVEQLRAENAGKDAIIAEQKHTIALERTRGDAGVENGALTREVMMALRGSAYETRQVRQIRAAEDDDASNSTTT